MELESIILKTQDFLKIKEEIKEGAISKSVLLITKDEHYSFQFALSVASLLFNGGELLENENYFKVKSLSHPDLKVYPQKDRLMVADSDDIVEEGAIKPIFANKKIFIIRNIDNGMEQAQNKILKTLEEPANNVYFILTTSNINKVLPTIRSRCNKIELAKLSPAVTKELCQGDELINVLCDGYCGKAIDLLENDKLHSLFESVISVVTRMKSSKNVLSFAKDLSLYKENFSLIIEMLSLIFEDILLIKAGKSSFARFKSKFSLLQAVECEYTVEAINEIRKLLNFTTKEMQYGCNFAVVIENLLLNILEVKYICR